MHFSGPPWPTVTPTSGFSHGSRQKTNFRLAGVWLLRECPSLTSSSSHDPRSKNYTSNTKYDAQCVKRVFVTLPEVWHFDWCVGWTHQLYWALLNATFDGLDDGWDVVRPLVGPNNLVHFWQVLYPEGLPNLPNFGYLCVTCIFQCLCNRLNMITGLL